MGTNVSSTNLKIVENLDKKRRINIKFLFQQNFVEKVNIFKRLHYKTFSLTPFLQ
jgi:hypothetical protein